MRNERKDGDKARKRDRLLSAFGGNTLVNLLDDGGDELGADSGGNEVALPGFIVIELFFILPRLTLKRNKL
jgi:hypothetical protein